MTLLLTLACVEDAPLSGEDVAALRQANDRTQVLVDCAALLNPGESARFGPGDESGQAALTEGLHASASDLNALVSAEPRGFEAAGTGPDARAYIRHTASGETYLAVDIDTLRTGRTRADVLIHEGAHVAFGDHSRSARSAFENEAEQQLAVRSRGIVRTVLEERDYPSLAEFLVYPFQVVLQFPEVQVWQRIAELEPNNEPEGVLAIIRYEFNSPSEADWLEYRLDDTATEEKLDYLAELGLEISDIETATTQCALFDQARHEYNTAIGDYATANGLDYSWP